MSEISTRADFYLGTGSDLQWLGSIGMDGMPSAVLKELSMDRGQRISGVDDWCESVTAVLLAHEEATHPDWGWPWPWKDSGMTDYSYVYDSKTGQVMISCYGTEWMDHRLFTKLTNEQEQELTGHLQEFPDMSAVMAIRWDSGNAPMVIDDHGLLTNPPSESADMNKPKEKTP